MLTNPPATDTHKNEKEGENDMSRAKMMRDAAPGVGGVPGVPGVVPGAGPKAKGDENVVYTTIQQSGNIHSILTPINGKEDNAEQENAQNESILKQRYASAVKHGTPAPAVDTTGEVSKTAKENVKTADTNFKSDYSKISKGEFAKKLKGDPDSLYVVTLPAGDDTDTPFQKVVKKALELIEAKQNPVASADDQKILGVYLWYLASNPESQTILREQSLGYVPSKDTPADYVKDLVYVTIDGSNAGNLIKELVSYRYGHLYLLPLSMVYELLEKGYAISIYTPLIATDSTSKEFHHSSSEFTLTVDSKVLGVYHLEHGMRLALEQEDTPKIVYLDELLETQEKAKRDAVTNKITEFLKKYGKESDIKALYAGKNTALEKASVIDDVIVEYHNLMNELKYERKYISGDAYDKYKKILLDQEATDSFYHIVRKLQDEISKTAKSN